MSWLGWGSSTNPLYEELVEKACSPLNLPYPQSENIADSLEVTDMIRSKAVLPKPAMQSLKRRVGSTNGRVQMYAIGLVDTCIKNGGDHFLGEIASKEFVDEMSRIIKAPTTSPEARQMALKYFQSWAIAFQPKRELAFFVDVYNELKGSGVEFPPPPAQTSSHLLTTTTAPQWQDSDVCMRCRTAFTFTNRKHHCRNCGLVFDQACSSKMLPLPLFGITTPVRVCDSCFVKCGGGKLSAGAAGPAPAVPTGRTMRSKEDFDADLQRAIEASLADSKEAGPSVGMGSEPPLTRTRQTVEDDDEELRMAIEASLRDAERARPSAPNGYDEPEYKPLPTFDLAPRETETILTFSNTLDQMAAYGERDLRRFPHAHVLYEQAYGIGGKLHRNVEEKTTKQQMLAEMQDKLSQAIGLYGNILDGQQAYNAQKLQEQQQRQYAQHQQQQSYGHYNPYQPQSQSQTAYDPRYAPQPQSNGYYAPPPQQAYQPTPAPAAPSLYPAMPTPGQAQVYPNQPREHQQAVYGQAHPYPNAPGPWNSLDPGFNPAYNDPTLRKQFEQQFHHAQQAQYPSQQPTLERHSSVRSVSSASAHNAPLQRHTSASYAHPQYPSEQTGLNPSAAHFIPAPSPAPSSAPPVDMSTHPIASPASSTSALPPNGLPSAPPGGYNSPRTSPQKQHHPQQQQQQYAQQPPQHVYYDTSFPPAPAAVFPDAPQAELDYQNQAQGQGIEKKEKEEALLIEL